MSTENKGMKKKNKKEHSVSNAKGLSTNSVKVKNKNDNQKMLKKRRI